MADKPRAKKTAVKAYKMPDKIPKGEKLKDVTKVEWIVQDSIGIGGFGEIYAGTKASEPGKVKYAIKIEPHENGPLFCERSVYINIGKEKDIEEYRSLKKLRYLGLPTFHGFGSHLHKGKDYRFIVIDKLGKDVWSLYKKTNSMPYDTVLKIGIQILHVLEYMHSKGYVHCDIKGANLLLGLDKSTEHNVYVVDFGLACKFANSDKPNPKKAHNGTIEYTSRDAHRGVMSRRGDVEILGYNLLHWASSSLPWEKETNPASVQKAKEQHMDNISKLMLASYKTETPHTAVKDYMKCISKLDVLDEPSYEELRTILSKDLKKLKSDVNKLVFGAAVQTPTRKRKSTSSSSATRATPARKKVIVAESDSEDDMFATPVGESPPKSPKRTTKRREAKEKENGVVASPRSRKVKDAVPVKRSWRDCPTIKSNSALSLYED